MEIFHKMLLLFHQSDNMLLINLLHYVYAIAPLRFRKAISETEYLCLYCEGLPY